MSEDHLTHAVESVEYAWDCYKDGDGDQVAQFVAQIAIASALIALNERLDKMFEHFTGPRAYL